MSSSAVDRLNRLRFVAARNENVWANEENIENHKFVSCYVAVRILSHYIAEAVSSGEVYTLYTFNDTTISAVRKAAKVMYIVCIQYPCS